MSSSESLEPITPQSPTPDRSRPVVSRRKAPAIADDLDDEPESPNRYEWESRALMAGFGTFFIGAIKNFLLLDATGFYLMLTAALAAAGTLIVTLIYLSRFQRTRTITKRELVAVAVMLGVTFAMFRNAAVTQQNWSEFKQRFQNLEQLPEDTVRENSLQPE